MGKLTGIPSNNTIRKAIQHIALHGVVNQATGAIRGSGKVIGYVAKIHKDGDLAGTIDVQEYVNVTIDNGREIGVGYHEGVLLSAIQNNDKGLLIVPKLYSDVIVSRDPESHEEFVTMYSHVDIIQLDSHDKISVGVREREEFDTEDESSPDIDKLKETGNYSNTTYTNGKIHSIVEDNKGNKSEQKTTSSNIVQSVGKDVSVELKQDSINASNKHGELNISNEEAEFSFKSSKVKINDGTVYLGSDENTDYAVLGVELADILSEFLSYMSQMVTTTSIGPQPPVNVAKFIALKAKIESYKASHSGFITEKVRVQK